MTSLEDSSDINASSHISDLTRGTLKIGLFFVLSQNQGLILETYCYEIYFKSILLLENIRYFNHDNKIFRC